MKLLSFFVLVLLLLCSSQSKACDCDSLYGLKESDFAFTGTVVNVVNDSTRWVKLVAFEIDSIYKSLNSENLKKLTLITPINSASCGYDFRLNERYVVFADRQDSTLENYTEMCFMNEEISKLFNTSIIYQTFWEQFSGIKMVNLKK